MWREPFFHERLQFSRQFIAGLITLIEHNVGFRLDQLIRVGRAYNGAFENGGMGDQRGLDLDGRNPLAADLEHVVRAPGVPVVAIGILVILIAGMNPVPGDGIFGLLMLVPIIGRDAVPANQQIANLALLHRVAVLIGNQGLVAGNQLAGAAGTDLVGPIADKDMQNLGAADAVEDDHVELILPAAQDLARQGLACRDADAHRGEVEAFLGVGQGQHARIERWHAVENAWPVLLDDLEHILGQRPAGITDRAGSHAKGEIEIVAESISEIKLGCGEGDIVLHDIENALRVVFGAVHHVVMQVDAAFGEAGAAGTVEPESAIVLARFGRFKLRGRLFGPACKIVQRRALLLPRLAQSHHHDMAQEVQFGQQALHRWPELGRDQQHFGPAVVEDIDVIGGAQGGIDWNRHGPDFHAAEKARGELRRVQQKHGHALLHLYAQIAQAIADAVGEFGDLGIGVILTLIINRGFGAAPFQEVAVQERAGGIELLWDDDLRYLYDHRCTSLLHSRHWRQTRFLYLPIPIVYQTQVHKKLFIAFASMNGRVGEALNLKGSMSWNPV